MSLTISQARLALGREGPARRSTAEYLIHQTTADLFGDRSDRGYLYRIVAEWPGGAEVLILSRDAPRSSDQLPERVYGRAVRVHSKPFAPNLGKGQLLDFELRVNATTIVTDPVTQKKHRTDIWEAEWRADRHTPRSPHQVYGEHLARKIEGAAMLVDAAGERLPNGESSGVRVTARGEVRAGRGDHTEPIRFIATNLIGTLRVHDPVLFLEIVGSGIGRGKAFGCGLLCLSQPGTVLARRRSIEVLTP